MLMTTPLQVPVVPVNGLLNLPAHLISSHLISSQIISNSIQFHRHVTFNGVGGEESQVLGFQRVLVGEFRAAALRFGFASQRRVVHFEASRFDDADVGGHTVAEFDLDDVTDRQLLGGDGHFLSVTDDQGELRDQVLETVHDAGALVFLVEGEDARHDDDDRQHDTQIQLETSSSLSFIQLALIHWLRD